LNSAAAADAVAPGSFEQAMQELETIVAKLDEGSLGLEQSLVAYRRGAELVKHCQAQLEAVREQVQVLDGELLRPVDSSDLRGGDAVE
jgi:exodeoxyribonuclease VII small subunit